MYRQNHVHLSGIFSWLFIKTNSEKGITIIAFANIVTVYVRRNDVFARIYRYVGPAHTVHVRETAAHVHRTDMRHPAQKCAIICNVVKDTDTTQTAMIPLHTSPDNPLSSVHSIGNAGAAHQRSATAHSRAWPRGRHCLSRPHGMQQGVDRRACMLPASLQGCMPAGMHACCLQACRDACRGHTRHKASLMPRHAC